ncbi:unnamed protein product, partial [Ectocarpus sp. 12 AP-2014]
PLKRLHRKDHPDRAFHKVPFPGKVHVFFERTPLVHSVSLGDVVGGAGPVPFSILQSLKLFPNKSSATAYTASPHLRCDHSNTNFLPADVARAVGCRDTVAWVLLNLSSHHHRVPRRSRA